MLFGKRAAFAYNGAPITLDGCLLKPELYFVIPGELQTLTGGYAYDRELIRALQAAGIRVHHVVLSSRFPAPDAAALTDAGAKMAAIPDHALVMIDGLAYGVMDAIAEQEHQRLNIIALCHHPLALESGLDADLANTLFRSEKKALALACAVVVTSPATAALLKNRFDIAPENITVALPGTRKRSFAPCRGNPPRLLTVATLTRRKAHDVLITALSQIQDLAWSARIVGGDHFDPAWSGFVKNKSITLGLDHRVHFTGSIDDLNAEYTAADIFVLPSRFEGYGMVFAEALSFGLPVVAAHAGAVPDVVPASAGMLVPADDADALAAALRSILSQPERLQALRHGAQAAAAELPDWQDTAARVIRVLQTVASTTEHQHRHYEA